MLQAHERLLIVEDEKNLGLTLSERLKEEGYDVTWAEYRAEALEYLQKETFQLLLVDVSLPDGTGFEIAEKARTCFPRPALVFLTAFGSPEDRIRGLELGAEDYVVKPFQFRELVLRLRNALKRGIVSAAEKNTMDPVIIGRARVSFSQFHVETENKIFELSQKECALLKLMFQKRGQAVSRDEILSRVWGNVESPSSRTIDNMVVKLRKLMEDPSKKGDKKNELIRSIRGVGYLLQ